MVNSEMENTFNLAFAGTEAINSDEKIIKLKFRKLKKDADLILIKAAVNETEINVLNSFDAFIPEEFKLCQNYPNPFNNNTVIEFRIPESALIGLKIYNLIGQEVKTLVSENYNAGTYKIEWDGTNNEGIRVNSGIYFYRLKAGSFTSLKKMVLLK